MRREASLEAQKAQKLSVVDTLASPYPVENVAVALVLEGFR